MQTCNIHSDRASPSDELLIAQRLAAIVESSDDAIISKDLNGIVQTWNKGAERIFGYTVNEMIGQSITKVIPPEFHHQEPEILARIGRGERIDRFETIRLRKDGSRFHISLTISPIRDRDGKIVGASKIGRDITDLRLGQERQNLLLREMNHRVKNLFAVASGVVALSARSAESAKDLATTVQARLSALSRAHELILPRHERDHAQTVDLGDLIRIVLAPYDHGDHRITTDGPKLVCGPSMSTSLALLLHEFATNSVKYGGLGAPQGKIAVNWAIDDPHVRLDWIENAAGQAATSTEKGFGSVLVDATVRSIGGEIERNWRDGALTISLTIPLLRFAAT